MSPLLPGEGVWTSRLIRNHRRPPKRVSGCLFMALMFCCLMPAIHVPIRLGMHAIVRYLGVLPSLGLFVALTIGTAWGIHLWQQQAHRNVLRWAKQAGWSPVVGREVWPWTSGQRWPDQVVPGFAVHGTVRGFPVTVGEVSWKLDGFGGAADRAEGRGIFAVLQLPESYPMTAVQRRRRPTRARPGEDEFVRQYRIIVRELHFADRLVNPALHAAHVSRAIPPWTIVGNELYTVVTTRRPLRPATVKASVETLLRIANLLEITTGEGDDSGA